MARYEVLLPQWGMGMSEGTVITWLKEIGDVLEEDDDLVEVEAEKVEDTVVAPVAGTLVEILTEPETTVPVRTPIAIIETA